MSKYFKVSSATKWRLEENVVLQLMECVTPSVTFDIFMHNHFTSFLLPTHAGVNNIRATSLLNKIGLSKCTIIGDNQLQKKKKQKWQLGTAHIKQKSGVTLTVVGQNDSSVIYIASYKSCEPKRSVQCWNKIEKKNIQEKQPNQLHDYNQNTVFVNRMDHNVTKHQYSNEKMVVVPVGLNGRCSYSRCLGIALY